MRIRMIVEYDGTHYSGWQRQKQDPSVQQTLEDAMARLFGQPITLHGAGRTDAGVHARGMVCHFDCQTRIPPERIAYALNFALPRDVRVKRSEQAADDFHARFDAVGKWYRYAIYNHPQAGALNRLYVAHVPFHLEVDAMQRALAHLPGTHDFAAFAASGSTVKNTVRTIDGAFLQKQDETLTLDVIGNGFLYNMVRIIAGTLLDVGKGKLPEDVFAQMIQSGDRVRGGTTAPAHGLTLMQVFYTERERAQCLSRFVPERAQTP